MRILDTSEIVCTGWPTTWAETNKWAREKIQNFVEDRATRLGQWVTVDRPDERGVPGEPGFTLAFATVVLPDDGIGVWEEVEYGTLVRDAVDGERRFLDVVTAEGFYARIE